MWNEMQSDMTAVILSVDSIQNRYSLNQPLLESMVGWRRTHSLPDILIRIRGFASLITTSLLSFKTTPSSSKTIIQRLCRLFSIVKHLLLSLSHSSVF